MNNDDYLLTLTSKIIFNNTVVFARYFGTLISSARPSDFQLYRHYILQYSCPVRDVRVCVCVCAEINVHGEK